MSWPPLSLNQVDLLTFRTCSLSSSQTNALWSSRRSWSWRVSQGLDPVFFFLCEVAVYCCVDSPRSSLVSSPPASFRLLFPLLQRPDSQPLLLSETQWVTPPNLQHRHLFFIIYFFFPAQFFFSFFFPSAPSVCPKWAKIRKQHTDRSSVIVLIVCSSALRAIELIKYVTARQIFNITIESLFH